MRAVRIGIIATVRGTNPVAKAPDMDEGFWRERAEEARRVAKRLSTTWARDDLLAIAYRYEHMARTARERKHSIGQWLRGGGRWSGVLEKQQDPSPAARKPFACAPTWPSQRAVRRCLEP